MNNALYIRRRSKVIVPPLGEATLPLNYAASVMRDVQDLGFTFSEPLILACQGLTLEQLTTLYHSLTATLRQLKGAHQEFRPMYPNFPAQHEPARTRRQDGREPRDAIPLRDWACAH